LAALAERLDLVVPEAARLFEAGNQDGALSLLRNTAITVRS
jgi:hypothetical protein